MKTPDGYTIFEVSIVLAISSLILLSAIALFKGQNTETAFNQAVQDINSELSLQIKQVGTSSFPNSEQYQCDASGGQASLSPAPGGQKTPGSNETCIYLGKAIEAVLGTADFYIYTILGNRCTDLSCANVVTSLADAKPTAAVDSGADLTVSYRGGGSVKVVSAKITTGGVQNDSTLVGYYGDLAGTISDSQSGSEFLIAKGYTNYRGSHDETAVKTAISSTTIPDIAQWELCLQDPGGTRGAKLDIINSSAGVTTNIKFVNCS